MHFLSKIFIVILFFAIQAINLSAQDEPEKAENLFDNSEVSGFAGVGLEIASINGKPSLAFGTQGAVTFSGDNFSFLVGIYFLNPDTEHKAAYVPTDSETEVDLANWGAMLGYIYRPAKLFHTRVGCRFGWGSIKNPATQNATRPFILTPHVDLELNLSEHLKAAVGAGYKMYIGVDENLFETSEFNSPMGQVALLWYF
ncbi:MAG: hypothetical protein ACLFQX_07625 [Candidatus Kapaibacterium sp.]